MEIELYLPFSPSQKVFLIRHPFDRMYPYPLLAEKLSPEILSNTRLLTWGNISKEVDELKEEYSDIKPVKITLKFDEEVYF